MVVNGEEVCDGIHKYRIRMPERNSVDMGIKWYVQSVNVRTNDVTNIMLEMICIGM